MKNKDIQFFFNRPDRSVNSGRITDILNGKYSDSKSISASSETELIDFFAHHKASETGVKIDNQPVSKELTHSDKVTQLFEKGDDGIWKLREGETDQIECKREFDPKNLNQIVRAVAALSNNKGGYVIIGVNDDLTCCNLDDSFQVTDVVHIIDKLKYFLSPTPIVTTKSTVQIGGKIVGFLHVEPHIDRPVIVYRHGDKLSEGDILFRYAGQSARILHLPKRSFHYQTVSMRLTKF